VLGKEGGERVLRNSLRRRADRELARGENFAPSAADRSSRSSAYKLKAELAEIGRFDFGELPDDRSGRLRP
jgi:hypothetical protein